MSSTDEAIALFADQDIGQTADGSVPICPATHSSRAQLSEDTWEVRRAIVRARSALIGMRLDDASRAMAQLKRLLSNRSDAHRARYASVVPILEGAILAADGIGHDLGQGACGADQYRYPLKKRHGYLGFLPVAIAVEQRPLVRGHHPDRTGYGGLSRRTLNQLQYRGVCADRRYGQVRSCA